MLSIIYTDKRTEKRMTTVHNYIIIVASVEEQWTAAFFAQHMHERIFTATSKP